MKIIEYIKNINIVVRLFLTVAAGASIGFYLTSCSGIFKSYRPDNICEEIVEEVIEHYSGISLDLSPNSPE
jgi:hypothetical protein